jgi:nucleotide-binding universal stress UspA family protein
MVAYDFSDFAEEALVYAAELSELLKADLLIVHVINQRDVDAIEKASHYAASITVDEYVNRLKKDRLETIDQRIKSENLSHLSIKRLIKVGIPFEMIIEAAREEEIQLVIMGPKGRTNIANILFGTTAEKMFRHCPVPLLSVRNSQKMAAAENLRNERIGNPAIV